MESKHWTEVGLANEVLRLHDNVLKNLDRDVKYRLQHQGGQWLTLTPTAAVREMATGEYKDWMGPFDEIKIDRRIQSEEIIFRRRPMHTERPRTDEELQNQIKKVRQTYIRI